MTDESLATLGITEMPASMKRAAKGGMFAEHFDSLVAFFEPRPMRKDNRRIYTNSVGKGSGRESWYGLPDSGAVVKAIRDGWPDGTKKMLDAIGSVNATTTAQSIRRVLARGDHGDEYDIHRGLSGGFDKAWTRRKRGLRPTTRAVTVVLNSAANYNINADKMFWRGAAALCLTDILSDAGYSVKVIVAAYVSNPAANGTEDYQYSVTVKEAHQQLDPEAVASSTALAGFFRVGGFRKICERPYAVDSSFGSTRRGLDLDKIPDSEGAVVVPETVYGLQEAKDWLRTTITSITGQDASE